MSSLDKRDCIIPTSEIVRDSSIKFENHDNNFDVNLQDKKIFAECFEETFSIFPSKFFNKELEH